MHIASASAAPYTGGTIPPNTPPTALGLQADIPFPAGGRCLARAKGGQTSPLGGRPKEW